MRKSGNHVKYLQNKIIISNQRKWSKCSSDDVMKVRKMQLKNILKKIKRKNI